MTTISLKDNKILSLLFIIPLWLLSACYQENVGCLDITAANYDATADVSCQEGEVGCAPCEYNNLVVTVDYVFDTLDFAINSKFVLPSLDTLLINDGHLILSNFCLFNKAGSIIKTQTRYDINGDGEALEYNDAVVFDLIDGSRSTGILQIKDTLQKINFHPGLSDDINNTGYDFANNAVSELIDSNYVNGMNQVASFRLEFQTIRNQDTLDYNTLIFTNSSSYGLTFPLDTIINYDDNPTLNLSADIALLFKDVQLEETDWELILIENLKNFIVAK